MPGDFEGLKIWIVGTLIILGYVSEYSWEATEDVNILVPHAIIAIVFFIALGIVRIIENERKKVRLGKRYTNSTKPRVMNFPVIEKGLIPRRRLLELEQLPLQSLTNCEPQLVKHSFNSHPMNEHSGCGSPTHPSKPVTFKIVLQNLTNCEPQLVKHSFNSH